MADKLDIDAVLEEFRHLKRDSEPRNREYWYLRNAFRGNFRWPSSWPTHIPKVTRNYCKPIVNKHTSYLMGKGFSYNVNRPNSLEFREQAERTEKILRQILLLSAADVQFTEGARTGSKLGRTIFKVYKKGQDGAKHACFAYCQPEYFYGVPVGPDSPGEYSVVYYSYPLDIAEAKRRYGADRTYKSEIEMADYDRYSQQMMDATVTSDALQRRRIPVLEAWTKDNYALIVGGQVIFNGDNPNKWASTGEGFVPFVVVENVRADDVGYGEPDIKEARVLNEFYNFLVSRRDYVVGRYLNPTLVWEGAPQNMGELLSNTLGGGGALPTRLGSRLSFLAYDRPNPAVSEQLMELRAAMLEVSGMNEAAYQGVVTGSINTGPALAVQFQPLLAVVEGKRKEWDVGLKKLFAMLLQVQEEIGDSTALGEAVINQLVKSQEVTPQNPMTAAAAPVPNEMEGYVNPDEGQLVMLSGKDIKGLRDVTISWPGVLPADDFQAARLEMEKFTSGLQSIYTTMEKLGEEYPDDEIARIRMENEDPSLRGEKVAEQVRSQTPLLKQAMDQEFQMQQQQQAAAQAPPPSPDQLAQAQVPEAGPPPDPAIGDRLRQMAAAKGAAASVDTSGDFPAIDANQASY